MKFVDFHCDTVDRLMEDTKFSLRENDFSVDLIKLRQGGALAQVFALFIEKNLHKEVNKRCISMLDRLLKELENNNDLISLATNYEEIIRNEKNGKMSAIISIEEGEALEGNLDNLQYFYNKGVRAITLTWNFENTLGFPNCKEEFMMKGLKPKGIDAVSEMNRLGVLVDVSHLSDGGFWDVVKYSKKPFIASHSNARAIANHSRNLADNMVKAIAEKGGIMGLNFCASFVGSSKITLIDELILHLKHVKKVGGIDILALGSDFDGIGNEVEIKDVSRMNLLGERLVAQGFTYDEVEKIFYKNALRVIKDVL